MFVNNNNDFNTEYSKKKSFIMYMSPKPKPKLTTKVHTFDKTEHATVRRIATQTRKIDISKLNGGNSASVNTT